MVTNGVFSPEGGKFFYSHLLVLLRINTYHHGRWPRPTVDELCAAVADVTIHLFNVS